MSGTSLTILLVEDNPGDIRLVRELLAADQSESFTLVTADRQETALAILDSHDITAILLDIELPDSSGLNTLLKIHANAPGIPIVVLSSIADEGLAVRSVQQGAQDFLVKGHVDAHQLTRSLRYAIERKRTEERLNHLAHYDSLTGLSNRKHFYDTLKNSIALARRHETKLALLLLDLNGFKSINDTLGHYVGDLLLQGVALRLRECMRETDCVARIGGDEFTLILTDIYDEEDAATAASKIIDAVRPPFLIDGRSLDIGVSVGISIYPTDTDHIESLVRNADVAMYQAKAETGLQSNYRFFSANMNDRATEDRVLLGELATAVTQGEFVINYQPQVDVKTSQINGMESLLRWQHPTRGLLLPSAFMNVLESSPLILEVGLWVLRSVCMQGQAWLASSDTPLVLSVNLSPRQLLQDDFAEQVAAVLAETGLPPHCLELDISEHALWEDEACAFKQVTKLNQLGVRLALDNFGNGRASFYYLRKFPFHAIKLDRRLTQAASSSTDGADMARAVIQVAHVFRMKGLAGGVETAAQLNTLRNLAYDDAQGYLYCHPLPSDAATALLERGQHLGPVAVASV
ncbi:bifunctional diguanylate cyclase/phosphodiesterase [Methylotenera sp.]|jgi:diguanylate cyclase (GGDEF)-like protein|uniref:putative bifunctional diguanylate cyclase/phosphodiesterase n=1 Tax=Methylotenera sp. TaxID=2051956 RepID=UPI002733453B|nr:GGDEF domain-containing response regulator [Methylotenera sp.]MDP3211160.1 EAL domain-containing protein [Methylotenera sp.]MDP3778013.1 EAL domain-containing protein [Methylotenera sp.]